MKLGGGVLKTGIFLNKSIFIRRHRISFRGHGGLKQEYRAQLVFYD